MPNRMPNKMSERMPEYMSDRTPERMSDTVRCFDIHKYICQIECHKACQIECQSILIYTYRKECQYKMSEYMPDRARINVR